MKVCKGSLNQLKKECQSFQWSNQCNLGKICRTLKMIIQTQKEMKIKIKMEMEMLHRKERKSKQFNQIWNLKILPKNPKANHKKMTNLRKKRQPHHHHRLLEKCLVPQQNQKERRKKAKRRKRLRLTIEYQVIYLK